MKRAHICIIATIIASGTIVVAATAPQAGPEHARLTAMAGNAVHDAVVDRLQHGDAPAHDHSADDGRRHDCDELPELRFGAGVEGGRDQVHALAEVAAARVSAVRRRPASP